MDTAVKQRLIGAAVLAALAMIFLPLVLQSPDVREPDAAQVPLDLPKTPDQAFETRELPLADPAPAAPEGGVLGLAGKPPADADPNAVVTVDEAATPPPPQMADSAPMAPVDAATGEPLVATPPAAPAGATPAPGAATPAPAPATPAPATPAPVAEVPLPAASAGGQYAVNVGSFGHLENARALAQKLKARNLPVSTESVQIAGKPALRLRVGPYAERAAAEAARLRVEEVAGGGAIVITLDAPAAAPAPRPATSSPVAAASRPAAAAASGFAVQLGALRAEADAIALRDRARGAGFTAFHQRTDSASGVLYRVRVGPEADRAAAERLRDAVAAKLGVTGTVVAHP